ncbi:MAG: T9SS type A sorting domain-containing protein [Bacteroidales bacterium]|nr:T9SS type A sorting domain-containing protein [Bacteroidales bacterium]
MKKYFYSFIAILIFTCSNIFGQMVHKCGHISSFESSLISDTLDAVHYYIHIDVIDFTGKEINGHTKVEISSKLDNIDQITLELQDLTVDSVLLDNINTAFTHQDFFIKIPLQNPLNTGEMATVDVYYHGVPFHEAWGGFHWSGQYAFNLGVGFESIPHNLGKTWFPCIDDFQDRAYYDVYATTTDDKMGVCGGTLVEIINNGNGTKTWHWNLSSTIPTYLASVAIGDYVAVSDIYNGINGDIPIEIYVRPQDSSKVAGSFLHLQEILSIFEDKFGPYRFERIGYVGTAIGAMEHATNIAYPNFCINNSTTYESLYAHELSHMWFGDNVTCSSAQEMWLNEGWAVFCEAIYREFLYSKTEYKDYIRDKHADVIQYCHTPSGDGSYFPLNEIPETVTYGMSAYDKGSTVAHSLRGYLGDDIFFDAIKGYNEHFNFNFASSYDMRDFLTSHTGIDMTGFFDTWVLTKGTPHYSIDSFNILSGGKNSDVEVFMRQRRKGSEFIGVDNVVEVTFMDNNWNQFSDTIHFSGETGSSIISVPFTPDRVLCDLDEKLCDATTDYATVIHTTGDVDFDKTYFDLEVNEIGDSVFMRVEHNWVPPDSLTFPVQGLTISDYRYWRIDGIFPPGFSATGKFWYNKNGYLDNTLITNPEDSVIIMYRPGPGYNWQYIDFDRIGNWTIGNLLIENPQPGEYTVAICDDTFVGINELTKTDKEYVSFFPNPSSNEFTIQSLSEKDLTIKFYDINGKMIDIIKVEGNGKSVIWSPETHSEGTFFARILDRNNTLSVEKLILVGN